MAKGAEAKKEIINRILELYGGDAMLDDKVIRIRTMEKGEPLEIKLTLTAAQDLKITDKKDEVPLAAEDSSIDDLSEGDKPSEEEMKTLTAYLEKLENMNMI